MSEEEKYKEELKELRKNLEEIDEKLTIKSLNFLIKGAITRYQ